MWIGGAKALSLSAKPLAIDSTYFEPRHASRHYELRLREVATGRGDAGGAPIRRRVNGGEAQAEYEASLLNAQLVAAEAKLDEPVPTEGGHPADTTPSVAVSHLRDRFLHHHEHVL